jgi:multidrug transporter EmrE-like cation transporter
MQYIAALISIILGATAQLFFKIGVTTISKNSKSIFQIIKHGVINPHLLTGMLFYGFSFILWFIVLSKMELSKAYPLISLGYIFTLVLGVFFLNESITVAKITGIAFIMAGVVFLTR